MSKRKSFIIHKDSLDVLNDISDEDAGKLFKAIKEYQLTGQVELTGLTKIIFSPFKGQFQRDAESYKKTCEARAVAGSKGGKQKVANASKSKQKVANLADSKSKSDSKSELSKDNNMSLLEFLNEKVGKKYRTVSKKVASAISARLAEEFTFDDIKIAITNAANSDYHKNKTEKYQYLTLEYITRPDQLDKWLNASVKTPSKNSHYYDHFTRTVDLTES